jgi:hypothetical protein
MTFRDTRRLPFERKGQNMQSSKNTSCHSRRSVLVAGAASVTAGFCDLTSLPAFARDRLIAGHRPDLMVPAAMLSEWLETLHTFGPIRNTGTAPCRAFEEWLATEFATIGCAIERDQFRLTSWETNLDEDCAITVTEDGGAIHTIEVLAYYPFSGSTRDKPPVSGRVLFGGVGDAAVLDLVAKTPADVLAQSVVVLDMPIGTGFAGTIKSYPESFPDPLPPLIGEPHPGNNLLQGMGAMKALEEKCKGLILCYTDVNREAVRFNFLPFTDRHRAIPALWTGKPECDYLQSVSGKATVTMRLDARLTPDARADTILATLKGDSDEVVLMTTQTDGPNECNENGGLGLLACATYLSRLKSRKRTFVFSLPTAHYAMGPVRDPVTGSGRSGGTYGVMAKWPDMIKRTVAQIAMEQLGAREWAAVDGKWQATGRVAQEHWIPTPAAAQAVNSMFMACTHGEDPSLWRADLTESGFPPGEGGALRNAKIPGVGLMGWPHYFFRADPKGVIDKLDPHIMHAQISMATKLLTLMDRLTPTQMQGAASISSTDLFGSTA